MARSGAVFILGSENLAAWHNIFALCISFHPFSDHYSEYIRVGNPLSVHNKEPIKDPFSRHAKLPTARAVKDLLEHYDFEIMKFRGFGHLLPLGDRLDRYHSFQFVFINRVIK